MYMYTVHVQNYVHIHVHVLNWQDRVIMLHIHVHVTELFDFQHNLPLPHIPTNGTFYLRVYMYVFGIHDCSTNNAHVCLIGLNLLLVTALKATIH